MASLELIHVGNQLSGTQHVIFVHGLGGHAHHTWMNNEADDSTLWPRWVGQDVDCPVWVLAYDAELSGWRDGAMPLGSQGSTVLDLIASEPRLRGARLILVGHSMGGLVIKTALIQATTLGVSRFAAFPKCVRGVVFLATPHFGSHLATLAAGMKLVLRTNEQLSDLRLHDAHLATLNTQFRAQHKQLRFSVRSFCETKGVTIRRTFFGFRPAPAVRVVDGADPHVDGDSGIYLPEDHFSICKPKNRDAQVHKSLLDFIEQVIERENSPFRCDAEPYPHSTGITESDSSIMARVNGCQIQIVAGRLEEQAIGSDTVVVLPCNDFFDDKCAGDTRSALGAYLNAKFGGQVDQFMSLVKEQCHIQFDSGTTTQKTETETGESFGVGKCLLLQSPLGVSIPVALLSTATQRPKAGLAARVSNIFPAIENLAHRMADARLNTAIMPILGAGHGGLTPEVALCGLLLAIAQVAREANGLKKIIVVAYRKDKQSPLEIDPCLIRQALSLAAFNSQRQYS